MSKTLPTILNLAYQKALATYCDFPRDGKALERLIRVREVQKRVAKHYGVAVLRGARA
jgi:hypothetical protein